MLIRLLFLLFLFLVPMPTEADASQSLTALTGTDCPQAPGLPQYCYRYDQNFNETQSANLADRFTCYHNTCTTEYLGGSKGTVLKITVTDPTDCDGNQQRAVSTNMGCLDLIFSAFTGNRNGTGSDSSLRCILCDMGFPDGRADFRISKAAFDIRCSGCVNTTGRWTIWIQSHRGQYANNSTDPEHTYANWMLWNAGSYVTQFNTELNALSDPDDWAHVERTLTDDDEKGWNFMDKNTQLSGYKYESLPQVLMKHDGDIIIGRYFNRAEGYDQYLTTNTVVRIDNFSVTFRHWCGTPGSC